MTPNTEYPSGIHPELMAVILARKIPTGRVDTHASDVLISCETQVEALQIVHAGPWRSMAKACRMNPDHPDAKTTPWLAGIPFARLSGLIAEKTRAKS